MNIGLLAVDSNYPNLCPEELLEESTIKINEL